MPSQSLPSPTFHCLAPFTPQKSEDFAQVHVLPASCPPLVQPVETTCCCAPFPGEHLQVILETFYRLSNLPLQIHPSILPPLPCFLMETSTLSISSSSARVVWFASPPVAKHTVQKLNPVGSRESLGHRKQEPAERSTSQLSRQEKRGHSNHPITLEIMMQCL